jgi:hypothetical protein
MSFLADDLLEGRATGSRAAKYMASQFEALGLKPAGDQGTYFQNVPLRSTQPDEAHTTFSILREGKEEVLTFRGDYVAIGDPTRKETFIEAPVVYVGFGITSSERNYDDYAGVEARGKIVDHLYGAHHNLNRPFEHATAPRQRKRQMQAQTAPLEQCSLIARCWRTSIRFRIVCGTLHFRVCIGWTQAEDRMIISQNSKPG